VYFVNQLILTFCILEESKKSGDLRKHVFEKIMLSQLNFHQVGLRVIPIRLVKQKTIRYSISQPFCIGKAKLTVIGKRSFKDVVRENVDKGAVIVTDTHISYQDLNQEYKAQETVNHSQGQYRDGLAYTNSVEGFFSIFKRTVFGTYHQISPKHLQAYCFESAYRFNTRKMTDKDRFVMTLSNVEGRLTYKSLIQKNH